MQVLAGKTRKDEVCSIRSKFPNKLPVIVERYIREQTLPLLDKSKFLVPFELTLGQFLCLLRNKIALDSTQALFLLVAEKSMSCMSSSMGEVYSRHRDTDGFLYITYASQEILPPEGTSPSAWARPPHRLHHSWSLQATPSNKQTNMAPFEKSMEMMPFKQRKCLETRKDEVCSIRSKFPNKLPVIVERYIREQTLPLLDKSKFLVPFELTLGQFLCLLRNKIALDSTQALFLLVAEKSMSCMSSSMGEVYSRHRDTDGFLYITYASQEMFGAPQPAARPPC
ncbi:uncharacterized protein map1lc3cl [Dicentrarchus labrax]|nr:uncharacterized protein map1lc3cl [Dicentrarchus labrax]